MSEVEKYTGEFWKASERLKSHERRVKEEQELRDLEKKVAQATVDALEAQKQGKPASLERHAELSAQRKKVKTLQTQRAVQPSSNSHSQPGGPLRPAHHRSVALYVTLVL